MMENKGYTFIELIIVISIIGILIAIAIPAMQGHETKHEKEVIQYNG